MITGTSPSYLDGTDNTFKLNIPNVSFKNTFPVVEVVQIQGNKDGQNIS